jgi:hypothetical protein
VCVCVCVPKHKRMHVCSDSGVSGHTPRTIEPSSSPLSLLAESPTDLTHSSVTKVVTGVDVLWGARHGLTGPSGRLSALLAWQGVGREDALRIQQIGRLTSTHYARCWPLLPTLLRVPVARAALACTIDRDAGCVCEITRVCLRVLAATTSAVIMQRCSFLVLARWCGIYAAMTCRKVAKIPVL